MIRVIVRLLVVLAMLFAAEIRLSRSDPRSSQPPPPVLWEIARPPGRPSPAAEVTRTERGLTVTYPSPSTNCPTLISTDPNSQYTLTDAANGVTFDIDGDGDLDRVAWTEPATDVAFLALDNDGDGRITSGRELIGDRTLPGVVNGPNVLMRLAGLPGTIAMLDLENAAFAKLQLWRDTNHNGISEASELSPADNELSGIGLGYSRHRRMDVHGNQSRFRGFVYVRTAPGKNRPATREDEKARIRSMYDVCLLTQ